MKTLNEAWNLDGVLDKAQFLRDARIWMEHPVTVRFLAALETMRIAHMEQITRPIKDENAQFNHNQNVHKGEVYREILALCESVHGKRGGGV